MGTGHALFWKISEADAAWDNFLKSVDRRQNILIIKPSAIPVVLVNSLLGVVFSITEEAIIYVLPQGRTYIWLILWDERLILWVEPVSWSLLMAGLILERRGAARRRSIIAAINRVHVLQASGKARTQSLKFIIKMIAILLTWITTMSIKYSPTFSQWLDFKPYCFRKACFLPKKTFVLI